MARRLLGGQFYNAKPDKQDIGRLQVYKASEGRAGFSLLREYERVPRRSGDSYLSAAEPGMIDAFKRWKRGQEGLN